MSDTDYPPTEHQHTSAMPSSAATVPNPDPTQRTVDQLQREIGATRQILEANIIGTREVLETRLAGMDKAIELLQNATDKLPDKIKDAVGQLQQLHDEKFQSINNQLTAMASGIEKQFTERDKRTEQLSLADKTAIAAALQAQKEAAGAQNESNTTANTKMEGNFAKLIEQNQLLLQEFRRTSDDKIDDVKSRLDKGEGLLRGGTETRTETRQNMVALTAIGGFVFAIISGLVGFNLSHFVVAAPPPTPNYASQSYYAPTVPLVPLLPQKSAP